MPPIGPPPLAPSQQGSQQPGAVPISPPPPLPQQPHQLSAHPRTSSNASWQPAILPPSIPPPPLVPPLPLKTGELGGGGVGATASPRPPVSPSAAAEQQIEPGKMYRLFLFSDLLIVARPHKKSSDQGTFKAIIRLPVQSLAVADLGDQEPGKFAFRVDYPQGALRLGATSVEHREVWVNTLSRAITDRKKTQVFAVPLGELMRRPSERNREVPQIFEDAATYIQSVGLEVEGVFRLSSSSTEVARMQCRIDAGRLVKFNEIHNTTGILKAWLRALPAPLMTYELYNDWLYAANDNAKLKACVARMPRINRYVLASLMGLLHRVAQHSEKNMMDAHNLAIVIAPNILYQRGGGDYLGSSDTCNVVASLITAYEEIFSETINEQQALRAGASAKKTEATHNRRERLRRLASKKELVPAGMEMQQPILSIPPPASPPPPLPGTGAKMTAAEEAISAAASVGAGVAAAFHIAPPTVENSSRQLLRSSMTVIPPPASGAEGSASGTEHISEASSTSSMHALPEPGPPPIPPPPLVDGAATAAATSTTNPAHYRQPYQQHQPPPPLPSLAPATSLPPGEEGDGGEGPEHRHRSKHRHSKRPSGSDASSGSPVSPIGASPSDPSPLVMSTTEKPSPARKSRASTGSIRHSKHRQSIGEASEAASASAAAASTSTDADRSDVTAPTPRALRPVVEAESLAVVSPLDTLPTVLVQASTLEDSMSSLPEPQSSPAPSTDAASAGNISHVELPLAHPAPTDLPATSVTETQQPTELPPNNSTATLEASDASAPSSS